MTMLMRSKADQTRLFQNTLDEGTEPWGVMVERVEVITIMLDSDHFYLFEGIFCAIQANHQLSQRHLILTNNVTPPSQYHH